MATPIFHDYSSNDSNEDGTKYELCDGDDCLNEDNDWIGCNKCPFWFHNDCLNKGYEHLTDADVEE